MTAILVATGLGAVCLAADMFTGTAFWQTDNREESNV